MKVSVVIRTLNEERKLDRLVKKLAEQKTAHDVELIVVDNNSTDGTRIVAERAGAKVVMIDNFTYPRSMNIGCEQATGEVIILTVGHAVPFTNTWIDDGVHHFEDKNTAGVYANTWYDTDATLVEKLMYGFTYYWMKLWGVVKMKKFEMGILGATNCAIRRSFWQQHPFDESYERGGEDGEWSTWAINQGYHIIRDMKFSVRHSHGATLLGMLKQLKYWASLGPNQTFSKNELLRFRKDLKGRVS